ncbi:MAG: hypothetical protein C5B49_09460 [Bdellovibrio sp.]|nr:MAG: hypothetical protein C5B49_09460 [Bdellovibrio sp.]
MRLDNLKVVAKAMHFEVEFIPAKTEDNVLASLARFGVPVAHSKGGNLSFEDTVKESLLKAREDGAYEAFVPFLLVKSATRVNPLRLAAKGFEANQVNTLGYFVEMANVFRRHPRFGRLLDLLTAAKNPQTEFLLTTNKTGFPELFEKNHLALKWNLKVRGTVEDHMRRWAKWAKSPKNN